MNRREFLQRASAVGVVGLAGCFSDNDETATETENQRGTPHADRYERVVNLAEAGADTTGENPIDDALTEAVGDDTLIYFPEGRYRMRGPWWLRSAKRVAFVGNGATFIPPDGESGLMFVLGGDDRLEDIRFEGLHFDVSAKHTGPRIIQAHVDDGLVVRDVSVSGQQDTDQGLARFDIRDPDGSGVVERLSLPDGGAPGTLATGCLVGSSSKGEITFRDCNIAGFPDNGLYASPAQGKVRVLGGRYQNSGISNVRVSGPSEVRGVHVRCDSRPSNFSNMRGIRLRHGDGVHVVDCVVEMIDVTSTDGGIVASSGLGSATIENTQVRIDIDGVAAIRGKAPSHMRDATALTCRNVSITGAARGEAAVQIIERPDSTFDGLCIEQTGQNRDGIYLRRSHRSSVDDTVIDVTGQPLVILESDDVIEKFSTGTEGGCNL